MKRTGSAHNHSECFCLINNLGGVANVHLKCWLPPSPAPNLYVK